jgi:hypothetical protein
MDVESVLETASQSTAIPGNPSPTIGQIALGLCLPLTMLPRSIDATASASSEIRPLAFTLAIAPDEWRSMQTQVSNAAVDAIDAPLSMLHVTPL